MQVDFKKAVYVSKISFWKQYILIKSIYVIYVIIQLWCQTLAYTFSPRENGCQGCDEVMPTSDIYMFQIGKTKYTSYPQRWKGKNCEFAPITENKVDEWLYFCIIDYAL